MLDECKGRYGRRCCVLKKTRAPWTFAYDGKLSFSCRWAATKLGRFVLVGHKIWDWRENAENNRVLHRHGDGTMDVYTPSLVPWFLSHPNCWTRTCIGVQPEECNMLCMMKEVCIAVRSILCSFALAAPATGASQSFLDVIWEWGMTGCGLIYAWSG